MLSQMDGRDAGWFLLDFDMSSGHGDMTWTEMRRGISALDLFSLPSPFVLSNFPGVCWRHMVSFFTFTALAGRISPFLLFPAIFRKGNRERSCMHGAMGVAC